MAELALPADPRSSFLQTVSESGPVCIQASSIPADEPVGASEPAPGTPEPEREHHVNLIRQQGVRRIQELAFLKLLMLCVV